MIDFSSKTFAAILEEMLDRVRNDIDKRELSLVQTSLSPAAWTIEGIYMALSQLQLNGYVLYAKGQALDYKAEERGLYRNPATAAERYAEFNVQVPIGARFQTIDGTNSVVFGVTEAAGRSGTSNEYYQYKVLCETKGSIGNEYSGSLLPITSVAGLTYARLTDIITAGTDEEDDQSLLQRYLLSLQEQEFAGNIAAYQNYILAQEDTGAVQVYPAYPNDGYVTCSVIDANFRAASPGLIERLQQEICPPEIDQDEPSKFGFGVAPIGAIVYIRTATELPINVSFNVQLLPGYNPSIIQDDVEAAIENYLLSVRRNFGAREITTKVEYQLYVYISRITAALLAVQGVVNVTNVKLNDAENDIELTETGALQQLPVMGTVTING